MATTKLPINTDTLLILEKGFESGEGHQQVTENLNVIEQLLIAIIEHVNENHPALSSTFIVRRLPAFTVQSHKQSSKPLFLYPDANFQVPYFIRNEYAVILESLDFSLSSPNPSVSDTASLDGRAIKVNLGHTEIYQREDAEEEPEGAGKKIPSDDANGILNSSKAYCSHEIFQRFSSAFLKGFRSEVEREVPREENLERRQVQLIGPHLLHSVKCHPEVDKIFTLRQREVVISPKKKCRCKAQVNQETSVLMLELDGTEVTVRPGLFLRNGYPKIHASLLERIPIYHPSILTIGDSLLKGCFLMPTNYETLWTIQFWPSESHRIFGFHPNSVMGRVFKLYGSFCLNPLNFWEVLNSCFLVGVEDLDTLRQTQRTESFPIEFLTSSFLHELEKFPEITDWEPKNFSVRLSSLLTGAIESFDKGFHSNYFTKRNVLRNLWKTPRNSFGAELDERQNNGGVHAFQHADSTRVDPRRKLQPPVDPSNPFENENLDDDEFGLQFEELSLDEREDGNGNGIQKRKSIRDSAVGSKEGLTNADSRKPSRSISKYIGATLLRRFSLGTGGDRDEPASLLKSKTSNRSMTDIAAGFEGIVNQQRREQIRCRSQSGDEPETSDEVFSSSLAFAETSFSEFPGGRGVVNEGCHSKDSIYATIFQLLNEISPSNYLSNTDLITHLDNCRRVLGSQGEIVSAWTQVVKELPQPKHICPHTFSPRQIQAISLIIQTLSKCTTNSAVLPTSSSRLPAWEIIGDILRNALHQMRSEGKVSGGWGSFKEKRKRRPLSGLSFKTLRSTKSFTEGSTPGPSSTSTRVKKFSFRTGSYDVCKYHSDLGQLDPDDETALALEDPETAASHRLLQWLWQLRNSEIGRLSRRAEKFMSSLYMSSLVQSHFLEQFTENGVFESMAVRSAVAVSRIMADEKYPTYVPLLTASKRGWKWAEMVLSFAAWNEEKKNDMKAQIPLVNATGTVTREINTRSILRGQPGGQQTLKRIYNPTEPDTEALNFAFHSEFATPLGMHDFEEPLRPGPYTVPILIFTASMGYYSQWEVTPGNIVHALVRLQKFVVLQHIATMLLQPHRKTALNEVRKLNKSLAYTAFQFEGNVMTKTFKRLASLRHTRRLFPRHLSRENTYSCDEVGCKTSLEGTTSLCQHKGKSIDCTRI